MGRDAAWKAHASLDTLSASHGRARVQSIRCQDASGKANVSPLGPIGSSPGKCSGQAPKRGPSGARRRYLRTQGDRAINTCSVYVKIVAIGAPDAPDAAARAVDAP